MLSFVFFCPSSPWWLSRKGRYADAERALSRLAISSVDVKPTLANIKHTLLLEKELEKQHNYLDCFRGPNLRRLIIAVMVYCIQPLSGQVLYVNYAVQFFEYAGLDSADAFSLNLGLTAIGFVGTIVSWVFIAYVGRRPIYIVGTLLIALLLVLVGILDVVPHTGGTSVVWAQCALILVCILVYDTTIGPACFTILCDIAAAHLRGITIGLASVSCTIWNVIFSVSIPYAMDSDEGNWKGKLGFLFGGIALLCTLWCFFCLPETKDRTFEELDLLFEERVPSRQFRKYECYTGNANSSVHRRVELVVDVNGDGDVLER